jgi:preprotein translocase subunit SecG
MEQELENIILENSFAELSAEDKILLSDLIGSEEEFDLVKQILVTAPTLNEGISPSSKLKASLMETFAAQHGGNVAPASVKGSSNTKIILFRSVAAVAAIFILFMFLFPFGNNKTKSKLTAENEEQTIKSKVDSTTETEKNVTEKKVESIQQKSIQPIQESAVQVAVNNPPRRVTTKQSPSASTNDFLMETAFIDRSHSDRLETYDLPKQSRQVVQDNPALLDILYTAF